MLTRSDARPDVATECAPFRAQTFAACDGELEAHALAALNTHLTHCAACRALAEADATFWFAIRRAVALDVAPASLRERVMTSLQTTPPENAPA